MAGSSIHVWKSWKSSIKKNLERRDSSTVTISKVPKRFRRDKNDDYEPRIISLGPYHHGKPNLQAMEKYKRSFLDVILSFRPDIPRQRYIEAIKEEEAKIRTCYIDYHSGLDSKKFVEMMLIDGCFVLGYLLQLWYLLQVSQEICDDLKGIVGMHDLIQYDIMLLENQLPFFILVKIFKLLEFSCPSSFTDLAINYLNWVACEEKVNFQPHEPVHHLLHLFHSHCLYTYTAHQPPSATVPPEEEPLLISIPGEESDHARPIKFSAEHQPPSATVLYEAGVNFEKKEEKGSSILDVAFIKAKGKMMIPPLVIDTCTKSRLRNLVVFEQFYPNFVEHGKSFTAYVQFMDFIVNTPADVALLHKQGIIRHLLGSDKKAANFLNDLNQDVSIKSYHYLAPLYKDVYEYQKKDWPKWRAMLMHNYCNSPWAVLGIVVGGILLVLTVLQTIFSGYSA